MLCEGRLHGIKVLASNALVLLHATLLGVLVHAGVNRRGKPFAVTKRLLTHCKKSQSHQQGTAPQQGECDVSQGKLA